MRKKFKRKFYRLNWNITAPELRVIDQKGKQVGILRKDEALRLAQEKEIDLVEVAPNASPPVCKLIDFKKFLYLEKKKERAQKKGGGRKGIKEIRLRPFIGDHDYQFRLNQAKEFLSDADKVRIRVQFFGREIAKKKFGFEIINRLIGDLGEVVKVEKEPHFIGRNLIVQLAPDKKHGQKEKSENQKNSPQKI